MKDPNAHDNKATQEKKNDLEKRFASRKEWLKEWRQSKPDRVPPCSGKAVYRLADSMGDHLSIIHILTCLFRVRS